MTMQLGTQELYTQHTGIKPSLTIVFILPHLQCNSSWITDFSLPSTTKQPPSVTVLDRKLIVPVSSRAIFQMANDQGSILCHQPFSIFALHSTSVSQAPVLSCLHDQRQLILLQLKKNEDKLEEILQALLNFQEKSQVPRGMHLRSRNTQHWL